MEHAGISPVLKPGATARDVTGKDPSVLTLCQLGSWGMASEHFWYRRHEPHVTAC